MNWKEKKNFYDRICRIYTSDLSAEDKYDMIFSDYKEADFKLDWYDPDTSYEEDVYYFKMALDEWIDKQEIIARQIDLDFE